MAFSVSKRGQFAAVAAASVLATVAAGGLAMAATDSRIASEQLGRFGDADLDNDGTITRAEWLRAAANRFAAVDADHNGKLVPSELPKPPRPGRHRRHGPEDGPPLPPGPDGDAEWGPDAPAAGVAPAAPVAQPGTGAAPAASPVAEASPVVAASPVAGVQGKR